MEILKGPKNEQNGGQNTKNHSFFNKWDHFRNLNKWIIILRYWLGNADNLYFLWNWCFSVPCKVQKVQKWSKNGLKNDKITVSFNIVCFRQNYKTVHEIQEITKPSDTQKCQFLVVGRTAWLIIDKILKMGWKWGLHGPIS